MQVVIGQSVVVGGASFNKLSIKYAHLLSTTYIEFSKYDVNEHEKKYHFTHVLKT